MLGSNFQGIASAHWKMKMGLQGVNDTLEDPIFLLVDNFQLYFLLILCLLNPCQLCLDPSLKLKSCFLGR